MNEALEHLVTVCENIQTLKEIILTLGDELPTEDRETITLTALKLANEATGYALRAMREIIHEG